MTWSHLHLDMLEFVHQLCLFVAINFLCNIQGYQNLFGPQCTLDWQYDSAKDSIKISGTIWHHIQGTCHLSFLLNCCAYN